MDYETILKEQFDQVVNRDPIEEIYKDAYRITDGLSGQFTLENILNATLQGEPFFQSRVLIDEMKDLIFYEVRTAFVLSVEILIICIAVGLMKSLSEGFGSKSISQLSVLICAMVIAGISMNSFHLTCQLALDSVTSMTRTMEILMPIMIGILLATGSVSSGTILSPVILGAVTGFSVLIQTLILPAFYLSAALALINSLTEKNYVNKLSKLIRSAATFLTGLLLTILSGIISLQGLLTETSDGLLISAAKFSMNSFIPIVGGFTSDTAELFLRCMGSIKSIVGVFGLATLLIIMSVPLIKILLIGAVYKLTAAVIEPITDLKITEGLNDMGSTILSVAAIVFFTSLLFIIFLSVIMKIGGAP